MVSRDKKRGGQGQAEAAHSACMAQQEGAADAADEKMAKDLFISPLWTLFPNHAISKLVFRSTLLS